jgi:hypothetical protein
MPPSQHHTIVIKIHNSKYIHCQNIALLTVLLLTPHLVKRWKVLLYIIIPHYHLLLHPHILLFCTSFFICLNSVFRHSSHLVSVVYTSLTYLHHCHFPSCLNLLWRLKWIPCCSDPLWPLNFFLADQTLVAVWISYECIDVPLSAWTLYNLYWPLTPALSFISISDDRNNLQPDVGFASALAIYNSPIAAVTTYRRGWVGVGELQPH